jgi:hypothetical protein
MIGMASILSLKRYAVIRGWRASTETAPDWSWGTTEAAMVRLVFTGEMYGWASRAVNPPGRRRSV